MKVVVQLKLLPTPEQADALLRTMGAFNAAANDAAAAGFAARQFSQPGIQRLAYRHVRESHRLTAQLAVHACKKAALVFARDKSKCPTFRPLGAVTYDARILSRKGDGAFSIATLDGRAVIPFVCGDHQRAMLPRMKGESDLVYRGGMFFLLATCDVPEPETTAPVDFLGVDMGIVNIAADSDGGTHSGEAVERCRAKYARRRAALNRVGTKSARRRLAKIRRRESNFRRDQNHVISKRLVAAAEGTGRGIALEELTGIRDRVTVRKGQRARHSGWAFHQLRAFVAYKAKRAGVVVLLVDPRNTSRTCFLCGHCEKANRKSQSEFVCRACGHAAPADGNAARNIRAKAIVSAPKVGTATAAEPGVESPSLGRRRRPVGAKVAYKPPASAGGN